MTQHDSPRTPRFCANCGAHNLTAATNCGVCGQPLVKREELARLWGTDSEARPAVETEVIDLYPTIDMSSQATTPFTQTRPFDPADALPKPPPPTAGRVKTADPWASSSGRLTRPEAGVPHSTVISPAQPIATVRTRKGPPGVVLGCLAVVLMVALAIAIVWGAVRASVSNRVEEEIAVGITNELRLIDKVPIPATGQIVITEQEINQDLDEAADWYTPVKDVRVTIEDGTIRVRFKLYGVSSTYKSGLDVSGGKIVAVDPKLSGPAGQFVEIDEITAIFESETQELLRRSGVRPVDVTLSDGSMTIKTKAIDAA